MRLPPHEGDIDILGGNEELGEWDGRNVGEAVGVLELVGATDGISGKDEVRYIDICELSSLSENDSV